MQPVRKARQAGAVKETPSRPEKNPEASRLFHFARGEGIKSERGKEEGRCFFFRPDGERA